MKSFIVLAACSISLVSAWAQPVGEIDFPQWAQRERVRIAAEREALESRWPQDERACYQRFAVNDCLRQARRQHRQALADLRRQDLLINDEERRRKGEERLRDLEQRVPEGTPRTGP